MPRPGRPRHSARGVLSDRVRDRVSLSIVVGGRRDCRPRSSSSTINVLVVPAVPGLSRSSSHCFGGGWTGRRPARWGMRLLSAGTSLRFLRVSAPRGGPRSATVHPLLGLAPGAGVLAPRRQRCTRAGVLGPETATMHPVWGFAPEAGADGASKTATMHPVRGFAPGTGALGPDQDGSAPAAGANPRTGCRCAPETAGSAPAAGANPRTGCRRPLAPNDAPPNRVQTSPSTERCAPEPGADVP